MKKIQIKFVDFWPSWNEENNFIVNILKDKYDVCLSDNPEYLFFSCFGYEHLKYDCVRIFYTGENIVPDFNICDYAIGFARMDFLDRYYRYPLYYIYKEDMEKAISKHHVTSDEVEKKSKFCNFVYSNDDVATYRDELKKCVSSYKRVDSGGRYDNNIGYFVEEKCAFQEEYKFSIAVENASSQGYITEKIIQAFAAKTIPIYWGSNDISDDFNVKAFVNCHNYETIDAVVNQIKEIDHDKALMNKMLSEPIFTNSQKVRYDDIEKGFADFILNIVDQSYKESFRRSRDAAGEHYELRLKMDRKIMECRLYKYISKICRKFILK